MQGYYMLVRRGKVQRAQHIHVGDKIGRVWPVARTAEDALRLIRHWKLKDTMPAMIGSLEGETLEGHIRLALEDRCLAAVCVMGWNDDGSPIFGEINCDKC